MNVLINLIQRFFSPNPKIFNLIILIAGILWCIAQGLLWIDNRLDILWINDGFRALFDDICVSTLSIIFSSQFTTTNKSLQHDADKLLNK